MVVAHKYGETISLLTLCKQINSYSLGGKEFPGRAHTDLGLWRLIRKLHQRGPLLKEALSLMINLPPWKLKRVEKRDLAQKSFICLQFETGNPLPWFFQNSEMPEDRSLFEQSVLPHPFFTAFYVSIFSFTAFCPLVNSPIAGRRPEIDLGIIF